MFALLVYFKFGIIFIEMEGMDGSLRKVLDLGVKLSGTYNSQAFIL